MFSTMVVRAWMKISREMLSRQDMAVHLAS